MSAYHPCNRGFSRRCHIYYLCRSASVLLFCLLCSIYFMTRRAPGDSSHRLPIPSSLPRPLRSQLYLTSSSHASVVELIPRYHSYWLMETSGRDLLTPRELCAVESTALHNQPSTVYLLVTTPLLAATDQLKVLNSLANIHIRYLDLDNFVGHSSLASLWQRGSVQTSNWPVSHLSDILRYLLLDAFGGTYLDMDVIVLRSLNNLTNFVGREYLPKNFLAPGIMNFELGHPVIDILLEELDDHFSGEEWGANGPGLLTQVMQNVCGIQDLEQMTPEQCSGVRVLLQKELYAINWREVHWFFNKKFSKNVKDALKESYVAHLWNKHSSNFKIVPGSRQPILELAARNCPKTFSIYFKAKEYTLR